MCECERIYSNGLNQSFQSTGDNPDLEWDLKLGRGQSYGTEPLTCVL